MSKALVWFVGRRIGGLLITALLASIVVFASLALAPGDLAASLAGGIDPSPETLQAIRDQFHLDDPVWKRYLFWLQGILTGDPGVSFVYKTDVLDLILPRIGTTLMLITYAATLIIAFGVLSGVVSGLSSKRIDGLITVITSAMMGAPTFVVSILLIMIFSSGLNWFPVFGAGEGFLDRIWHLTLPAVALAFAYVAYVSRITRSSVRGQMGLEHVETARSRGIPHRLIVRRHILRNASPQILAASGLTIASLIATTAVAERAFAVSGIGSLLVEAAARRDLPTVQLICLILVVAFVFVNTLIDIVNAAVDPRTAGGARS